MLDEPVSAAVLERGPGSIDTAGQGIGTSRTGFLGAPWPGRVFGVVAGLVMAALCVRLPWMGDLGLHLATARRFAENLGHPVDPMVGSSVPSPYYSPLTLAEGAVIRCTGLSAHAVLSAVAACSCVLLFSGLSRLVRMLGGTRRSGQVACACVLLLWGPELFAWSGYPSLNSLALGVAYPSTAALAMTVHLWVRVRRQAVNGAGWPGLLATGAGLGAVLLVHQFTGATAVAGCTAMACGPLWRRTGRVSAVAAGFGVLVVAVLVVTVWPYYDFWALSHAAALDPVHRELYRHLAARSGLAVLGVPALAARWRRDRLDPLLVLFALALSVYVAGALTGHWSCGRIWPAVMLALQVALALELHRLGRLATGLTAAALAVGLWAQAGVVAYLVPAARPALAAAGVQQLALWDTSWQLSGVRAGDVVLAVDPRALRMLPAFGLATVAPAYPDMFLPDGGRRWRDSYAFFSKAATPARRAGVLARYRVRWIVAAPGQLPATLASVRRAAAEPGGLQLYRVTLTGGQ